MSASTPKFSRFPTAVDLRTTANTDLALVAAIAATRGRRRDGTVVDSQVSLFAEMFSGNANHCWRVVRKWANTALGEAVSVIKNPDGSQRFKLIGGKFIKFPTWAVTSGVLSRVAIVALLGLCSGLQFKDANQPVTMTRKSLRKRTGLGDRSVTKGLVELEHAGVITRIYRFNHCGRRKATGYKISWDQGARQGIMDGARDDITASARHGINSSEGLISEDYSSDPPPPPLTADQQHPSVSQGGRLNRTTPNDSDQCSALLAALCARNGTWATSLDGVRVTKRDRRRITQALGGLDPIRAARDLDSMTPPHSLHGVWRPLGVLPKRLDEVVHRALTQPERVTFNDRQRQMQSRLAGEIACGDRQGPLADWQHLIDELA